MKTLRPFFRLRTWPRSFPLALSICLGLSVPSTARTVFDVYGGKGDAQATDECPAGSYFTGLVGNTGSWIDQISVVCGTAPGDGTVKGGKSLPSRGGAGGAFKSVLCGKDEVVHAIDAQRTPAYQILQVTIHCVNLKTQADRHLLFGGDGNYAAWGPAEQCPPGEYGTGLNITFGQHVNGVGLICNAYKPGATKPPPPVAAPQTPPPVVNEPPPVVEAPPQPAPPAGQFVTVLKDVDVYSASGGNDADKTGEILTAGTANVKLVQSKSPWFHVQWPGGDGWVYSGSGYVSLQLP